MNGSVSEGKLLSEQFGVAGPPAARPLAVIEAELDVLEQDTRRKETALIENYIEVGRRLEEVKAQLPHGEWGSWLESRGYPQAKAVKLMKVFRAYGKEQQSLFGGEAKSQAFANLGFHKLVQLLAIEGEEDREQFVAEHDVEHMSTRELERALREREEALEAAAAAKDEADRLEKRTVHLQEQLSDQAKVYEAKLTSANVEADQAKKAQEKAAAKAQRLQDALSKANAAAQEAEAEHTRLRRELEELRSRPIDVAVEVDAGAVEAARQAAVAEMAGKVDQAKADKEKAETARKAAEEALAAARKELSELKAQGPEVREPTPEELQAMTTEAVERARAEDAERLRGLERQLAAADPNVAEFKVRFTSWQEEHWKMMEALGRIAQDDQERAQRLRQAVKEALEQMGGVEGCS